MRHEADLKMAKHATWMALNALERVGYSDLSAAQGEIALETQRRVEDEDCL